MLHAIRGGPSLPVFVDGARGSTLAFGQLGRTTLLSPGVHELILVPSDTSHSLIVDFTAAEGADYSAFAIDSLADGQAQTLVVLDSIPGLVTWRLVPNRN